MSGIENNYSFIDEERNRVMNESRTELAQLRGNELESRIALHYESQNIDSTSRTIALNANLDFMRAGSPERRQTLDYLLSKAREYSQYDPKGYDDLVLSGYNFNPLEGRDGYDINNGELCCARFVSEVLGIQNMDSGEARITSVMRLLAELMSRNLEATNGRSAGMVFGYANYPIGSVVARRDQSGLDRYGHVKVVYKKFEIDGVPFIAFMHHEGRKKIEFRPVDASDNDKLDLVSDKFEDVGSLSEYPDLLDAYEFVDGDMDGIDVLDNADASQVNGQGDAFAIDTSRIVMS